MMRKTVIQNRSILSNTLSKYNLVVGYTAGFRFNLRWLYAHGGVNNAINFNLLVSVAGCRFVIRIPRCFRAGRAYHTELEANEQVELSVGDFLMPNDVLWHLWGTRGARERKIIHSFEGPRTLTLNFSAWRPHRRLHCRLHVFTLP